MREETTMRSGGQMVSAQMAVSVISLVVLTVLGRLTSPDQFAQMPIALAVGALALVVTNLGLTSVGARSIPQHLARGENGAAGSLLRTALILQLLIAIPIAVVVFAEAGPVARLVHAASGPAVLVQALPFAFLYAPSQALNLYMQACGRFRTVAIVQVVSAALQQLAVVPLYLAFGMPGVILGALPIGPLVQIVTFVWTLRGLLFNGATLYPARLLAGPASSFYAYGFVRYLGVEADLTLAAVVLPPAPLAVYYVGRRFGQLLFGVFVNLYAPVLPRIAQAKVEGKQALDRLFTDTSHYIGLLAIPACLVLAALGQPALRVLFGERYANSGTILLVQAVAILVYVAYSLYVQNIYFIANPAVTLGLESTNGVLSIAGEVVLGVSFGAIGFAVGNMLGYIVATLIAAPLTRRYIDARVDWPALGRVTGAVVPAVALMAVPQLIHAALPVQVAAGIVGVALLGVLLRQRLNEADRRLLNVLAPGAIRRLLGPSS